MNCDIRTYFFQNEYQFSAIKINTFNIYFIPLSNLPIQRRRRIGEEEERHELIPKKCAYIYTYIDTCFLQ